MSDPFSLPSDEIRRLGTAALELVAEYYDSLPDRKLVQPTSSEALRGMLAEPMPQTGTDFGSLVATFEDVIARYSRHNAHPRFFGYISSPGTPITTVGSLLAGALNLNLTCWRSAPSATEMEHITVNWLKEMLGYPADAAGLFTSGGSMANFAALAAARTAKCPGNVVRDGLGTRAMRVYVSAESHFSIRKAVGMLGIGERNVREIRTDDCYRIDLAQLERTMQEDLAAGHQPFCLVANAGTTATGSFDSLADLAAIAHRYELWLHVDAAYGGFAALAPSARPLFAAIAEADSVALDPHKWMYLPVGCGCVLYRDAANARACFSHDADYTRTIGLERDEAFAFWDYGPELSRPFRAWDVWLLMKFAGAARLGEAIERNIRCAKHLAELVSASDDFEMLAPVELSVFCFRYAPRAFTGDLNALNERIMIDLNRGGSSYVSNANLRGKFALRGCVVNYRTTERDMEILLEDVRNVGRALACAGL